jgi:hypothetical protein
LDAEVVSTFGSEIGLAILQNALADLPADGIVIHPSDWMRMRLLKDGDGKYILGILAAMLPPFSSGCLWSPRPP